MKITQAFPTSVCAEKNGLAAQTLCRWLGLTLAASLGLMAAGCSTTTTLATTTAPANPSQRYFAPTVGDQYASTYAIDHTANTFVRDVYGFDGSTAAGATVTDSGAISTLSNGVVSLAISYNESTSGVQTIDNPPLTGNWAVELPGEAALIGMKAYSNFTPAVPTESCPNLATPETFLFVTIPNRLSSDLHTCRFEQMESPVGNCFWNCTDCHYWNLCAIHQHKPIHVTREGRGSRRSQQSRSSQRDHSLFSNLLWLHHRCSERGHGDQPWDWTVDSTFGNHRHRPRRIPRGRCRHLADRGTAL